MKIFYKSLIASLVAVSSLAVAVDKQQELTFELEATIPSERSYVKFSDPVFGSTKQEMVWDEDANILNNVSTNLQARNTEGKISAHLLSAAVLEHEDTPANNIPLTVRIGTTDLRVGPMNPSDILTAANAADEKTLPLVVSPTGSPSYEGGNYAGEVTMVFDHEIP
jgi:molecular chaperone DnaK (HSP70)